MVGPRTAPIHTGSTSTFTLKQKRLHIILLDPREAPYAGQEYVLTVGRTEHHGRTAADGSLSHEVPGLPAGELVLKLPAPDVPPEPEPPSAAAPPGAPPPYPPPVRDADFADGTPAPAAEAVTLHWTLQLQSLVSFDSDAARAAQERLRNLGFSSIRAFQRCHGLPETGQLADVQQELIQQHDT